MFVDAARAPEVELGLSKLDFLLRGDEIVQVLGPLVA
jgi:hypothetical protein